MPLHTLLATTGAAAPPTLVIDLLIVLAVAAVVAVVLQRLSLEAIPAYLIGGAIVGPHAFALVASPESLQAISNLAIVLLMFGIGLQLNTSTFRRGALWLIGVGAISNLLMIALGWPAAMLLGMDTWPALAVAMAFSNSSTAVVLRILTARRELHHANGRLILSTLIVQDLLVVGMLALMPYIGVLHAAEEGASATVTTRTIMDALMRIAAVGLLVVLGKIMLPRILREAARGRSAEVMTVLSVALALAAALATQALVFSAALGAFLAGFLLSSTPFRFQLSAQIGPARDLFIAVFFTTVGMNIHPDEALRWWWLILVGGAVTVVIKLGTMSITAWSLGAPAATAIAVGFALFQAGEFSLVMLSVAAAQGLLSQTALANATAIVVLTLILTPEMFTLGRKAAGMVHAVPGAPWLKSSPLARQDPTYERQRDELKPAILCGYGIVGRAVGEELEKAGIRFTLIELNPLTVATQERLGRRAIFGDASNADVLESAGIHDAGALILTLPDEEAALRACATARRLNPDIFIAARTNFAGRGHLAQGLGANYVVVEEIAAAQAMQREIIRRLRSDDAAKRKADGAQGRSPDAGNDDANAVPPPT